MFSPDEPVLYPSYWTSRFFIALLLYHHCYVQAAGHPVCTGGLVVGNLSQVLEFLLFYCWDSGLSAVQFMILSFLWLRPILLFSIDCIFVPIVFYILKF